MRRLVCLAFVVIVLELPRIIDGTIVSGFVGHRSTIRLVNVCPERRTSGDGDDDVSEIFFDDFSGQTIGGVAGSVPSPSSMPSELPEFDSKVERGDERIAIPLPKLVKDASTDLIGSTLREFGLGTDVVLSNYVGSAGFDKVTDWQYYAVDINEDSREEQRRTPVSPRPMDPDQPARTRSSSGSIVRLFRGELVGRTLGSKLRSRGLDPRVLIKEYSGDEALALAQAEKMGLGRLQSSWLKKILERSANKNNKELLKQMEDGEWIELAQRRYVDGLTNTQTRKDDENLITFLELALSQRAQFACLLGELNLNDYYDDDTVDPNAWYKSLSVKPPMPGSVWLVFDYHGLNTAASYAVPSMIQRSKLPPKRGIFGGVVEPPALPPFYERARYMVQGVLKGMLTAVSTAHDAGIVHRSIGRNSFVLSSIGQDKREGTSPYAVVISRLRVILSDWGFSALAADAAKEKESGVRSQMFGIPGVDSYENQVAVNDRINMAATEFAKAEDLNALGFVFLGMLFTTLAEPATLTSPIPASDDDTLQRLFSEIFEKDMEQFRDYCANEEVWGSVVELLDKEDGAGWDLLGSLLLSRERLRDWYKQDDRGIEVVSATGLISHPFFLMKI